MPTLSFTWLLFDNFTEFRWNQGKTAKVVSETEAEEKFPLIQDESETILFTQNWKDMNLFWRNIKYWWYFIQKPIPVRVL